MGEGGFGKGGGFGGPKGKGKGKGKGKKGKGKGKGEEKEWVPVTKLGRLVKDGKIPTIEDIYLHSLPIKEYQIVDNFFVGGALKDEVMKIHPVQNELCWSDEPICMLCVGRRPEWSYRSR